MKERYALKYLNGYHYRMVIGESRSILRGSTVRVAEAVERACDRCGVSVTRLQRMRIEDEVYEREAYARTGASRVRLEWQWDGSRL